MSIKLRNTAQDASVTLVDGGAVGSPTLTLDVRDLLHVDSDHAGRRWVVDAEYKAGDLVTKPHTFTGGFILDEYFTAQTSNNIGNDPSTDIVNWEDANIVRYITHDIKFTIGLGKDFEKLDTALRYLARYSMVDGANIVLEIDDTHIIDYTMEFIGNDFTGIYITTLTPNRVVDIAADASVGFSTGGAVIVARNTTLPIFDFNFKWTGGIDGAFTDGFLFGLHDASRLAIPKRTVENTNAVTENTKFLFATANSYIFISGSTFTGGREGFSLAGTCTLQGNSVTFVGQFGFVVKATESCTAELADSTCIAGAPGATRAIISEKSSSVNCANGNFRRNNNVGTTGTAADYVVLAGGIIRAGLGGANQTVNTITGAGIIFAS